MSFQMQMGNGPEASFMSGYLEALALVERLHRLLLDVIKDEFERVGVLEINAVQALLLFNIGDNEVIHRCDLQRQCEASYSVSVKRLQNSCGIAHSKALAPQT